MSRPLKTLLIALASALLLAGLWRLLDDSVYRFSGLAGPATASVVGARNSRQTHRLRRR